MDHRIIWFDIPVRDLNRASAFYRGVLNIRIDQYGPDVPVAVMQHGADDIAGCLAKENGFEPSAQGPLLYFTVEGRLAEAVAKVTELGGKVIQDVHDIKPHGYRAIVHDTEGNRICLHSEVN